MPAPCITINGQQIPFSVVQKVRAMCGGEWDDTIDAFWKARNATGSPYAVTRYVMRGFVPNDKGVRYSLVPSKERENGQMESLRDWWNGLYERKKPVMSVKDIFAAIAAGTER